MSMQICVLSDARLSSIVEWQQSIDTEGLPLRLEYDGSLAEIRGFLPAHLGDKQTGFECHHVVPSDVMGTYPGINFGHAWTYVMAFIWIGDFNEMQAAWMAATAYARATAGIVFDEDAGQLLTPPQALQVVRDMAHAMPKLEAAMRKMNDRH
jgi:hypothetical protein